MIKAKDISITYDQAVFAAEAKVVDWGILISEWQGSAILCICAESKEQAINLLEQASIALKNHSE